MTATYAPSNKATDISNKLKQAQAAAVAAANNAEAVTYNPFAQTFSEILEELQFAHKGTVDDIQEIWEKSFAHGSTRVSVDYLSGEVVVEKFDSADRLKRNETQKITLRAPSSVKTAARFAI